MSISSLFSTLPFLHRHQFKLDELGEFLDLIPQPVLLIDFEKNQVILPNALACELTAFTKSELMGYNLETLIPDLSQQKTMEGLNNTNTNVISKIVSRSGTSVDILITLTHFNSRRSLAIASLELVENQRIQQAELQRHGKILDDIQSLLLASQENELQNALRTGLQAGHWLTGASILAIYLVNPQTPELIRTAAWGLDDQIPDQIPATEINDVMETQLWIPGKRSTSSLLRSASSLKLAYVATAPLGQPGKFSGLIVVADPKSSPDTNILALLDILSTTFTSILQHNFLASNLRENQGRQLRNLAVGDMIKESVNEGVIIIGSNLKIIEMNPSAEWTLGYASREVEGQPVENVIIGAENLTTAIEAAQKGVPTHNLGNIRLHRRDGSVFLAHLRILPIFFNDHLDRIICLLRDLSEREQFQARNQQLEQRALLGEITAIFAHEVRNPINNISTGLQLITYNLPDDDPNQEIITRLGTDCDRLAHLMQSVLAFSSPAKSRTDSVDLGVLLHRLLERWRPRMARIDVEYNLHNLAKNPLVNGDSRALEQVFTNLISNAVQAMGSKGGMLTVNLRTINAPGERSQVEISVSDTGPGIPEEIRERIFDPFFTTSQDGTGLGLAIAKRIVTAHKGTINVTSVPGGTVFQVRFPVVERTSP